MAALAFDRDRDLIGRGHQRALAKSERTDRRARPIVHAIDLVDAKLVQKTVIDHRHRARAALLGGLEDDDSVAGEVACLSKALRRAEQHRGMPVMAAGVHLAGSLGAIGEVGLFLDRQRVHVRAQSDRTRPRSLGATNDADHAGAADGRFDLVAAKGPKAVRDEFRGLLDVVHDLGILMEFSPPGSNFGNEVVDGGADRHRRDPCETPDRLPPRAIPCQRSSAFAVKEKNRLVAQEIPSPWREHPIERPAIEIKRDALVDRRADLARQRHEIGDGAEMDVRGVVPGMGKAFRHRHAAEQGDLGPNAPMAEIRHRHDGAAADAQHVFEHDARLARGLQRLGQNDIVERVVRVVGEIRVGVALNHRQAFGDAIVHAVLGELDAPPVDVTLFGQEAQQFPVAAANVENAGGRRDKLGHAQQVDAR